MLFRRQAELRAVRIEEESLPVSFRVDGPHQVTVRLHRDSFEDAGGYSPIDTKCEALMRFEPSLAIREDFGALAQGRLPSGSAPERCPPGLQPPAGQFPGQVLPERLRESIRQIRRELGAALDRTVALVRWRIGDDGPHEALVWIGDAWSIDEEAWHPMPLNITTIGRAAMFPLMGDQAREDVQSYLDNGLDAPLAHALWREAWHLRGSAPRSALLIGMAALEVGVKQYIAAVLPDAQWLLEELPAPPVHRLLAEYIPKLPTLSGTPAHQLDPTVRTVIRDAQHLRNKVAHAGRADVDVRGLEASLETVRGVLWNLDVYRGFGWALAPQEL